MHPVECRSRAFEIDTHFLHGWDRDRNFVYLTLVTEVEGVFEGLIGRCDTFRIQCRSAPRCEFGEYRPQALAINLIQSSRNRSARNHAAGPRRSRRRR